VTSVLPKVKFNGSANAGHLTAVLDTEILLVHGVAFFLSLSTNIIAQNLQLPFWARMFPVLRLYFKYVWG
jgi:hypothetical protein